MFRLIIIGVLTLLLLGTGVVALHQHQIIAAYDRTVPTLEEQVTCYRRAEEVLKQQQAERSAIYDQIIEHNAYHPDERRCYVRISARNATKDVGISEEILDAFTGKVYGVYLDGSPKPSSSNVCQLDLPNTPHSTICEGFGEFMAKATAFTP
jgi:hypothetical protein